MFEEVKGFGVTIKRSMMPKLTIQYPDEKRDMADRFRGLPSLRADPDTGEALCVACGLCARICPTSCLEMNVIPSEEGDRELGEFILRSGRCMFCGLCAQVCPVDAITMSKEYEISVQDRDGLVYTKTELATIGGQTPTWWDEIIEPPVNAAAKWTKAKRAVGNGGAIGSAVCIERMSTMTKNFPIYLAGSWVESDEPLDVINPYNGDVVGITYLASAEQLDQAVAAAETAFQITSKQPVFGRVKVLDSLAAKMQEHRDHIASLIALEAGKPIRDAEVEADRGIFTIQVASEEAKRIGGDVVPLDLLPSSKGRFGVVRRFPIGPVAGISPFNFPLNLALHKVAPAIASGNPIVLKPPTKDPLVMLFIARLLDEIGIVPGSLSVLPMSREVGNAMVEDPRFKLLSFTGSPDVGWEMKKNAGMKKVVLELGGNAGVIVDADSDAAFAAQRVRVGAFAYAGQVCISVQRVFIHEQVYDQFVDALVAETRKVKLGDPLDRDTDLGPMIDDKAAARSERWIQDAVAQGARVLIGGKADGRFMQPTIIENAPREAFVCSREAFAPLVTVFKVPSFGKAVAAVNDSIYGLQAGVFTNNLEHALYAFENIEAGGVVMNDIPTYRIDHMPYGGVKSSGLSREGIRYTIEDMTEMRLLVINRLESQRVID